jgi:spore maturation protein CgeB
VRILVSHPGPGFSVADVYVGWVEALRAAGQQVLEFNLGDRLVFYDKACIEVDTGEYRKALTAEQAIEHAVNGLAAALYKTRPHVLLSISTFWPDVRLFDMARHVGTRVVLLHTESPYEDERQLKLAAHADLNLLNDPMHLEQFQALAPTVYAPHAYRPTIHCPGPTDEPAADLTFVGTGYPSRVEFLEAMNLDGVELALAGNWMNLLDDSPLRKHLVHDADECFDNEDAVGLYRAAKAGLNLYRREAEQPELAEGWAMGPREVEMAAAGLFFLRDPRGEGDDVFDMLPTFADPADASEQLRWWLRHDRQREAAALKARAAIEDRTFDNHAAKLLRLLTEGKGS